MSAASKNVIEHAWTSFDRAVLPANAGAVQRSEMQMAFYAGAAAVLGVMTAISEKKVSDATGVSVLAGMHRETREFVAKFSANAHQRGSASH